MNTSHHQNPEIPVFVLRTPIYNIDLNDRCLVKLTVYSHDSGYSLPPVFSYIVIVVVESSNRSASRTRVRGGC